MADMKRKKRNPFGEKSGAAKLDEETVRAIRKMYIPHSYKFGAAAISRMLGMSYCQTYNVIRGKYWRHV